MNEAGEIVGIARAAYEAYVAKDRAAIEKLIAPDFHFTSPLDNRIDRATYFARCWPTSEKRLGLRVHQPRSGPRPGVRYLRRPPRKRPTFPQHRDRDRTRRPNRRGRSLFWLVGSARSETRQFQRRQ
jgi:hypothetical protein